MKCQLLQAFPYYTFESYSNGVAAGASATVTKDTVITVNYTADTNNLYTFYVYNTPDDFYNSIVSETWDDEDSGAPTTHNSVAYNQLVTVNIPGAYAIAKGVIDDVTGDFCYYILAYGDSYSFYAHESIGDSNYTSGIVGITEEQYKNYQVPDNEYMMYVYGTDGVRIVAEQDTLTGEYITKDLEFEVYNRETPVFTDDNSKFSLIGTFICPTGYEMVETGFLMTKGTSSLTIEMLLTVQRAFLDSRLQSTQSATSSLSILKHLLLSRTSSMLLMLSIRIRAER
ncbi:MAG: hypothetical protein ACLTSM_01210 [Eubacterium sp.]